MDYEKLYKDALERAREMSALPDDRATIEYIFPELKESEEERIRKALIKFFSNGAKYDCTTNGISDKDILAWLEKQESVEEIVARCKDSWYNEGKIAGMAEGLTDDEKYQQGWHDALKKQGEKPQGKTALEAWKDMSLEVYAQASGNKHEPNCSDNNTYFDMGKCVEDFRKAMKGGEE